jgi:hypothetical protein
MGGETTLSEQFQPVVHCNMRIIHFSGCVLRCNR